NAPLRNFLSLPGLAARRRRRRPTWRYTCTVLMVRELRLDEGAQSVGRAGRTRLCDGPDRRPRASLSLSKTKELLHHQHRRPCENQRNVPCPASRWEQTSP
uniref:Uncharacterized protein n=1 Tax=Neogobius melanostomus TaxID=47308 RepID=A0A8C6T9Q6_9GOBI